MWLFKKANSDKVRIKNNIDRLSVLRRQIEEAGKISVLCQSAAYEMLRKIINEKIVQGRPDILNFLTSALQGENNQKIVLDSPNRFRSILYKALQATDRELILENKLLSKE